MVVEARKNGYVNNLHDRAKAAANCGSTIDADGMENPFTWFTNSSIEQGSGLKRTNEAWAAQVSKVVK